MTTQNNRGSKLTADQKMIDGIQKFLSKFASLPVGSQTLTPADIVKVFQDRLDTGNAVVSAEAARTAAIKADRDKRAQTNAFAQSFRRMVLGMFSQSPDTLAIFGLKAPKVVKKTVDAKAAAVAKSKATRVARGTKGSKQKKAIKASPPPQQGAESPQSPPKQNP